MALGDLLAEIAEGVLEEGDDTLVNGQGPVKAFWDEASSNRIMGLLKDEEEWDQGVYEVQLPLLVLADPYNLRAQSELFWVKTGNRAVVRRLPDQPGFNDVDLEVTVLAVIMPD